MFISGDLIPPWLALLTGLLMLGICLACALLAPWAAIRAVPARMHLVLGGAALCLLLWLMSVHMIDRLWLHLLGVTVLVMLLGLRFALLAGAVATLLYAYLIGEALRAAPLAWSLTVLVPALVSRAVVHNVTRLRSDNLFLYLLGAGFGGGMLAMLAMCLAALPVLWMLDQRQWLQAALENWPLVALVLFPEGFINGMIITTLTVFYPHVVKTFDDKHYLGD